MMYKRIVKNAYSRLQVYAESSKNTDKYAFKYILGELRLILWLLPQKMTNPRQSIMEVLARINANVNAYPPLVRVKLREILKGLES